MDLKLARCIVLLLVSFAGIYAQQQSNVTYPPHLIRPGSNCTSHMIASSAFQTCVSVLGNVNSSLLTHEETCRYYSEAVYCTKRDIDRQGDTCSLADIEYMVHLMTFIIPATFTDCKVVPETGNLCSQDRLAEFSLTSCRPVVKQISLYPQTNCIMTDYLLSCTKRMLTSFMHTICTDTQLQAAFASTTADSWLQRHFPSLDLRQCFKGTGNQVISKSTVPTTTPPCVRPIDVIGNKDVVTCLLYLGDVIPKGNNSVPTKAACSMVNEALVCMNNRMKKSGYHCDPQQTYDTLMAMLHMGDLIGHGGLELVSHCRVNSTYFKSSMCSNSYRLVTFLSNTLSPIFHLMESLNNKALKCTTLTSSYEIVFKNIHINCTSDDVWSALASPYGQSELSLQFPQLDVTPCYSSTTTTSDNIVMNERSRLKRNAVAIDQWLWKDRKIPYIIEKTDFSTDNVNVISQAISTFNRNVSCVKFTPRTNEFDYIVFRTGQGCHSSIGRDGGEQAVHLGPACFYQGVILHEMLHAVGFFHEHSRWDRDQYVTIHWNNIQPGMEHDFDIQDKQYLTTLGAPYDYTSIMHYGPEIFAKDGNSPTMTPKYDVHGAMGQRDSMSPLDVWKVNTLYGCEKGPPPTPKWMKFLPSIVKPLITSTESYSTNLPTLTTNQPIGNGLNGFGKPTVRVTVFPNALRINWDRPQTTEPITGYVLTYRLEPNGRQRKVMMAANKLAYYLSTFTSHPGRRYTVSVAAITASAAGKESDPVTVRSACSQTVFLDNSSFSKIHSPFFSHGYYEQDVICEWRISCPSNQKINLKFTNLNIQPNGEDCNGDFVHIGHGQLYCNRKPTGDDIIMENNNVTVTFVSKSSGKELKRGGFTMTASANGYAPLNLKIYQLLTAFNISWEPPLIHKAPPAGYAVSYRLTSDPVATMVKLPATSTHFVLSTYPHFGRKYSIEVSAIFPTFQGSVAGPLIQRSICNRNITVDVGTKHLNSPHYPGQYEPGTRCIWNIESASGRKLVLTFEHTNLGHGDFVDIFDGSTYIRIDQNNYRTIPVIVDRAVVQFESDDTVEGTGFLMNIKFV